MTVIQEETKRTEEKGEAGNRSPTWSILRALQKINKVKRLQDVAVLSAPPFFQLAGPGDLKFWGEDDRHTVVVWESLLESDGSSGRKRWSSRKIQLGWFGASRGKKMKINAYLKSMEKKSSQTTAGKQKPKKERRWIRKEAKGSQCAGKRGVDRATSNLQYAKSVLHVWFTKIAIWQTSKNKL